MTITVAAFPDLLDVDVPTGNERYVIPAGSVALTDKEDWYGHFRETLPGLSFNPVDPLTFNAGLTAGYQTVNVGGAKTLASATGLTNDATVYTADVLVDGGTTYALSIVGSTAQTYAALLARINSQLKDEAKAEIVSGNIRITSPTKGGSSSIAITDTDLFSTLTDFVSVVAAVPGVTPFRAMTFNKDDAGTPSLLVVGHKTSLDAQLSSGAEVTPVTMRADVGADLKNKHWLLNSPTISYYIWYKINTKGYQEVDVGGAIAGGSATGLTNDATVYTANIDVDGVTKNIAVTGSAAQTYTDLLAEINTDLAGAALATLVGGNVRITSVTTGVTSLVDITDVDLFSSLTDFVAVDAAVDGLAASGTDPVPAGKTLLGFVTVDEDAADTAVATATRAVIDAHGAFVCPAPVGAVLTITNAVGGVAADAADGDVGGAFSVGSITQGTGLGGAYIPA